MVVGLVDVPHVQGQREPHELLVAEGESGICRVICFSARHDLTLAEMTTDDIVRSGLVRNYLITKDAMGM